MRKTQLSGRLQLSVYDFNRTCSKTSAFNLVKLSQRGTDGRNCNYCLLKTVNRSDYRLLRDGPCVNLPADTI